MWGGYSLDSFTHGLGLFGMSPLWHPPSYRRIKTKTCRNEMHERSYKKLIKSKQGDKKDTAFLCRHASLISVTLPTELFIHAVKMCTLIPWCTGLG